MPARIPRALAGRDVTFRGYDGRDYPAHVARVRRGVATVRYAVARFGPVVAYVSDASRLVAQNLAHPQVSAQASSR